MKYKKYTLKGYNFVNKVSMIIKLKPITKIPMAAVDSGITHKEVK